MIGLCTTGGKIFVVGTQWALELLHMLWYTVDFIACYCYIGVYIFPNKAMSIFSYTINDSKYSTTCISGHLHKKTTFVLQEFVFLLVE